MILAAAAAALAAFAAVAHGQEAPRGGARRLQAATNCDLTQLENA
eukprot:SAG31_NODE_38470_length_296_cov_0.558376_1_plen_44_part_01